MAANPNPAHISPEMWRFWEEFKKIEPTVKLGGIYANKPGYHNYRDALPSWDYSRRLKDDLYGPGQMAAAIDLTFPDAQAGDYKTIRKYSTRLLNSGKDLKDMRGNYLREFYGNVNGDTRVDGWDFQYVGPATSDNSHLWHIHLSFIRKHLNNRVAFDAILSILRGETWPAYVARVNAKPTPIVFPPVDRSVLIQEVGKPEVYLTNGVTYWHIPNMTTLRAIQSAMTSKGLYPKIISTPVGDVAVGKFGKKS